MEMPKKSGPQNHYAENTLSSTNKRRAKHDLSSTKSNPKLSTKPMPKRRTERRLINDKNTKQEQALKKYEALIKNIDACKQLSTIARTSFGPNGTDRLVYKLFLNELVVEHPTAKLLVLAANEQQKKFGDGANIVVSIAGQHLEGAKELITNGLNPTEIINGYKKASNKLGQILEALVQEGSETMDVRNKDQVILRMRAPVFTKVYENVDFLCPLIAEACIQVCPKNPVNFNVDNVRVAKIFGTTVGANKTFKGMVLKIETVVGSIQRIEKAKVLVIAGGVDTTESEQLEDLIKDLGAKVLVSGAGVGQKALQFCNDNRIMVLKIASQFELDCFCRTTDAVALLKLKSTVDPSYLGDVDSILVEKTRGDRVTVTNEQGGVATVLLGVATGYMGRSTKIKFHELQERAVVKGVNTYKALCRDSRIVPGAGATEIEIARRLRVFAFKETGSSDAHAIAKYADSFELITKTLAQHAYLDVEDIMETLKADHEAGNVKVGIDVEYGDCKDASTLNIWDLYTTKYHALKYAADAVCDALSVDEAREPQSMFDRLMAEHNASGESLWQNELRIRELISLFYKSIWTNNLQPKREMEMLAVKSHGDKLFGLSSDGTLSSFDIRSSLVCWSIPTDMALYLDLYKSSESSYFVDSSRVFIHTKETKPVDFRYHKFEAFEEPFKFFNEDIVPSRLVTQMYFDPVEGCRTTPLISYCDEILCIRAIHGQLTSYERGTKNVLWYERVATFYIWIVGREEGVRLQQQQQEHQSRMLTKW